MALNSLDKNLLLHYGLKVLCDIRLNAHMAEHLILVSKMVA